MLRQESHLQAFLFKLTYRCKLFKLAVRIARRMTQFFLLIIKKEKGTFGRCFDKLAKFASRIVDKGALPRAQICWSRRHLSLQLNFLFWFIFAFAPVYGFRFSIFFPGSIFGHYDRNNLYSNPPAALSKMLPIWGLSDKNVVDIWSLQQFHVHVSKVYGEASPKVIHYFFINFSTIFLFLKCFKVASFGIWPNEV